MSTRKDGSLLRIIPNQTSDTSTHKSNKMCDNPNSDPEMPRPDPDKILDRNMDRTIVNDSGEEDTRDNGDNVKGETAEKDTVDNVQGEIGDEGDKENCRKENGLVGEEKYYHGSQDEGEGRLGESGSAKYPHFQSADAPVSALGTLDPLCGSMSSLSPSAASHRAPPPSQCSNRPSAWSAFTRHVSNIHTHNVTFRVLRASSSPASAAFHDVITDLERQAQQQRELELDQQRQQEELERQQRQLEKQKQQQQRQLEQQRQQLRQQQRQQREKANRLTQQQLGLNHVTSKPNHVISKTNTPRTSTPRANLLRTLSEALNDEVDQATQNNESITLEDEVNELSDNDDDVDEHSKVIDTVGRCNKQKLRVHYHKLDERVKPNAEPSSRHALYQRYLHNSCPWHEGLALFHDYKDCLSETARRRRRRIYRPQTSPPKLVTWKVPSRKGKGKGAPAAEKSVAAQALAKAVPVGTDSESTVARGTIKSALKRPTMTRSHSEPIKSKQVQLVTVDSID